MIKTLLFCISYLITLYLWRYKENIDHSVLLFALSTILLHPTKVVQLSYEKFMEWPGDHTLWVPPSKKLLSYLLVPFRWFLPVKCRGVEKIPRDGKVLFVGNHQLFGLDMGLLLGEIYEKTGLYPRILADRSHQRIPVFKQLTEFFGAVKASPSNCATLMQLGQPILVFPGGANEVFKDERHKKYSLIWKQRTGFAKLAIENGYTIVPFASVGVEDFLDVKYSFSANLFWRMVGDKRKSYSGRSSDDLGTIRFPVPFPALSKRTDLYISFGDPLSSAKYDGETSMENIWEYREDSRLSVERLIQDTLQWQSKKHGYLVSHEEVTENLLMVEATQEGVQVVSETTVTTVDKFENSPAIVNVSDTIVSNTFKIPKAKVKISDESSQLDAFVDLVKKTHTSKRLDLMNDTQMGKFLIGHKYNEALAVQKIGETLDWMNEYGIENITKEDFSDLDNSKKLYIAGKAKDGTPVVVFRSCKHIYLDYDRAVRHVVWFVETQKVKGLDSVTLIVDRFDITDENKDDYFIKHLAAVFQPHYPETLKRVFIVPPTFIMTFVWPVVKMFLDPLTANKVNMLGKNYTPRFLEYIDKEQLLIRYGGELEDPTEVEETTSDANELPETLKHDISNAERVIMGGEHSRSSIEADSTVVQSGASSACSTDSFPDPPEVADVFIEPKLVKKKRSLVQRILRKTSIYRRRRSSSIVTSVS